MHKILRLLPLFAGLASCSFAQTGASQRESLPIGPGDLVDVQVYDTPEMEQEVRVTDGGMIPLSFIGEIRVIGCTPSEAAKRIEQALIDKQIMKHPQVIVDVEQHATQNVSVMGEVQTPGVYPIVTGLPVLKILSMANGLTATADRNIVIERHSNRNERVKYFLSNNGDQAFANSVLVYPGDTVLVPKANLVYVLGDVLRPGGYPMNTNDSNLTVLEAIASAGALNKTAKADKTRLIRKTSAGGVTEIDLQLSSIERGKISDIPLQPNDVIYVPFSWMKNMALSASNIAASTSGAAIYATR